jgi:septal ring factor EnvC (AmiA/AmiB activator)
VELAPLRRAERCACELFGMISAARMLGWIGARVYETACESMRSAGLGAAVDAQEGDDMSDCSGREPDAGAAIGRLMDANGELCAEINRQERRIRELERERDELMLKLAGKPKCEVCDRTTMLTEIEGLTAERDYWRQEVQFCMDAAYRRGGATYDPKVMAYPDRGLCTTPSTLVSATIDGLRDEQAAQYLDIVKEAVELKAQRDAAIAERDELRERLSQAIGYASDILRLQDLEGEVD